MTGQPRRKIAVGFLGLGVAGILILGAGAAGAMLVRPSAPPQERRIKMTARQYAYDPPVLKGEQGRHRTPADPLPWTSPTASTSRPSTSTSRSFRTAPTWRSRTRAAPMSRRKRWKRSSSSPNQDRQVPLPLLPHVRQHASRSCKENS